MVLFTFRSIPCCLIDAPARQDLSKDFVRDNAQQKVGVQNFVRNDKRIFSLTIRPMEMSRDRDDFRRPLRLSDLSKSRSKGFRFE